MLIPSKSEAEVPKFSPRMVILVPGVASFGLMPVTTGAVGVMLVLISQKNCHRGVFLLSLRFVFSVDILTLRIDPSQSQAMEI